MTTSYELASRQLLAPVSIGEQEIDRLLGELCAHQLDYADIYFQASRLEAWTLEDGIVKEGSYNIEQGAGIRANSGEKTGFAYTDDLDFASLLSAAKTSRAIAASGSSVTVPVSLRHQPALYQPVNPLDTISREDKIQLLHEVEEHARAQDPRIQQVIVSLVAAHDSVVVAATDGTLAGDIRPLVRMNVHVIAEQQGRREQGSAGAGGRTTLEFFITGRGLNLAEEASRQALVNLEAVDAPAGLMPVVLGSGWPGVLLHEAVGHGLEGDFNRKGTSVFSGRVGEQVASPLCTVVDDGTLEQRRGSLNMDDEGTQTQQTVLIEKGILKGYMQDKLNARLSGCQSTGNGRRESYAHLPMPRMTNTYMLAGEQEPDEIIASVDKGLYAVNFGGGQVDITSGKFVFSASEAYLIENGKITVPVKGATLIGNGPDVLTMVSMVGNDLALDAGVGVCGKDGQSVPVGIGQPTLKIDELTVGGTA
ncbi:metalloprotease TldD [Solemya elarraichensis gill symbiont]|uniref:Metalloprotease TldD n=1 Tax=Solemya elarraichensis gill symbiont TaxID=1918949 RepID=A0A1T2LCC6_9GAMM|nr:metalloprotease TldD [Solemya elarraichensis gill symbiont]OOZ42740.1 metalloprotease TldD [Solemya elarraichensis gill symbiont]